jgi:hypothetical protein
LPEESSTEITSGSPKSKMLASSSSMGVSEALPSLDILLIGIVFILIGVFL